MRPVRILWLFAAAAAFTTLVSGDLDDFPLDGGDENPTDESNDATKVNDDMSMSNLDMDDDDEPSNESSKMADRKSDTMQKLVQAAMRKPGMKERLAQVVPIVKAMTPAQRLALAGMVMGKGNSQNLNDKVLNAQLLLPISQDIAAMLRNNGGDGESSARASSGYGSYHLSIPQNRLRLPNTLVRRPPQRIPEPPSMIRPYMPAPVAPTVRRQPAKMPETPSTTSENPLDDCVLFGDNICLDVQSYPDLEILESIEDTANSRTAFQALTKDPKYNITDAFDANIQFERRVDGGQEDAICQSKVIMSRPKKARSTNGQWKYVVNTEEYVQTLRLEKCSKPEARCSHVSTKFKSTCHQVHNYHRLLTWDQFSGLTMDIFKVPTCCSCHLQELNPLTSETFETHNSVADDLHSQPTITNQRKVIPHQRPQQSTSSSQFAVQETHPDRFPAVTRRPYKKSRNKLSTPVAPTDMPDSYLTTRTNYNYHPIMEYFVPQASSTPGSRSQDAMQRKVDILAPVSEYLQTTNSGGWTPIAEEYSPRKFL